MTGTEVGQTRLLARDFKRWGIRATRKVQAGTKTWGVELLAWTSPNGRRG